MATVTTTLNPLVKLSIGLDISKDKFNACLNFRSSDGQIRRLSSKEFGNRKGGFDALQTWVKRFTPKGYAGLPCTFVMEATGVYYENLAYYLDEAGHSVSVQLASNVKHFGKSFNTKSKTDEIDAEILAQMGIERALDKWEKPTPFWRSMRTLCRERVALIEEKTVISNQLHALKSAHQTNEKTLARLEALLDFMKKQVKEIEKQMREMATADAEVNEKITNVCTIKGVEMVTALTIVAECNGFANFHSKAQLVSYAGYDVVQTESGTMKKKTYISKKGNRFIRRALHFPAQVAIQRTQEFKDYANRIIDNTKIKMKGAVAIQRKLLILIYKLFTKNEAYQENYHQNNPNKNQTQAAIAQTD
jgi:transposase